MRKIISAYRTINLLSLDIVAGAIINALFFAKLFSVHILPYGIISLGLTVWIIYTADHLRDAKSIKGTASTDRHRFHQKNFHVLLIWMTICILADSVIIFFMRKPLLEWGILLFGIVFIYLIIQRYLKILKELFVACLYTCGILLPTISAASDKLTILYGVLILQFMFIAFTNLLIFSWFDKETDRVDQQHSFVTILGKDVTSKCIYVISSLNLLLGIYLLQKNFHTGPVFLLSLINILLLLIFVFKDYFERNNYYRLAGDFLFLIPGIYLLWNH